MRISAGERARRVDDRNSGLSRKGRGLRGLFVFRRGANDEDRRLRDRCPDGRRGPPAAGVRRGSRLVAHRSSRQALPRLRAGLGGQRAGALSAADSRRARAAGAAAHQPQPGILQCSRRSNFPPGSHSFPGSSGCSCARAAPRPTKARSSWRASGVKCIVTVRSRSSRSWTAFMGARSRRWRPAASRAGTGSSNPRCRAFRRPR